MTASLRVKPLKFFSKTKRLKCFERQSLGCERCAECFTTISHVPKHIVIYVVEGLKSGKCAGRVLMLNDVVTE